MENINKCLHFLHIDKRLIKPKVLYFVIFAAQVSLVPFSPVYFKSLNLSEELIGVLGALPPWMAFLGAPIGTAIADKFNIHKIVMIVSFTISTVLAFSISLTEILGILIVLVIGSSLLDAPVFALLDNAVLDMLGPDRDKYGQQRLWGAVSFGIVAPIVGALIYLLDTNIKIMFWSYLIFRVITFIVLFTLEVRPNSLSTGFIENLRHIIVQPKIICFLITIFAIGMNMGVIGAFLFVYLQEVLKGDFILLGLTVFVTCAAEVIYFVFSHRVQALIGHKGVLYASLVAYIIRFLYYSLIENPWVVLGAEVLHGFTFGGMWSSSVAYADELAPKGMGATLQGLLTGVCFGLGGGAGSLVGGQLYTHIGPLWMFRAFAIWSAITLIFFWLTNMIFKEKVEESLELVTGDDSVQHYLPQFDEEKLSSSETSDTIVNNKIILS